MKVGTQLRVKVGEGDTASKSGNGIEDGDIVTFIAFDGGRCIKFTRANGSTGSAWAKRFEVVVGKQRRIPTGPGTQLAKVRDCVLGQGPWTLAAIAAVTGASEAAASARLRDLRANGYIVTCSKPKGEKQRVYTVETAALSA